MTEERSLRIAMVRCGALRQQGHLTTLCRYLVGKGIAIDFVSLEASNEDVGWFSDAADVVTHGLGVLQGSTLRRFLRGGLLLRSVLRSLDFDILYVVDSWALRYLAIATWGGMRWGRKPLVYHTFDMLVPGVARRADLNLECWTARRSQLNVNADRSRAEVAKALFGLRRTPLVVPVRCSRAIPVPAFDSDIRASLMPGSVNSRCKLVVNPTGLSSDRMGKEILRDFALLPDAYHLVTFDGDSVYSEECKSLVAEMDLGSRVRILPRVPHERLMSICASADVGLIFHDESLSLGNFFCHPSRLAYFIAMGLPVVGTDVPALESIVYRYGLGVCCAPRLPGEIARALRQVCEGSPSLLERSANIRSAFERDLNFEASGPDLVEALRALAWPEGADGPLSTCSLVEEHDAEKA